MIEQPQTVQMPADMRGPSAEADCLDCIAAFPVGAQAMRTTADESISMRRMNAHTSGAFARLDAERADLRLITAGGADRFYQHVVQLTIMDRYTRSYVSKAIRPFFQHLTIRSMLLYYILDNTLREDRLQATIELFELAGVSVVTPYLHGKDWGALSSRIRSCLASGLHVAYVEPDAKVNYLEAAQLLAGEFPCVGTFRNLAPEVSKFTLIPSGRAKP
jgi:hypothetical protein